MTKQVLQDALELLAVATFITPKLQAKRTAVINAGLQALAEQPAQQQEPLGYLYELIVEGQVVNEKFTRVNWDTRHEPFGRNGVDHGGKVTKTPLYTSPPAQKEPVDFASLLREAIEAEREACAMVCEDLPAPERMSLDSESFYECVTLDCADAIRARGENT